MKDIIVGVAVFIVLLLVLPFLLAGTPIKVKQQNPGYAKTQKMASTSQSLRTPAADSAGTDIFTIYNTETKKTENVAGFDFICGVVAGEMPSEYDPEALKAQAVAAYSYCCYLREHAGGGVQNYAPAVPVNTASQKAYIITGLNVAYYPKQKAQAEWGADFAAQWNKIVSAVSAVYGKAVLYNGTPAETAYCDMSSGTTEDCDDVWGGNLPYLVEVSSPGDKLQKNYLTHVTVKNQAFKSLVVKFVKGAKFMAKPSGWITDIHRSKAGGVITAKLCGVTVTGQFIRGLFSLRSTNFTLNYKNGIFTFAVKGNGHGVGMSQCGAQYMALHGSSWEDIIRWYYRGVAIGDYRG